jgi:hypothetical protein
MLISTQTPPRKTSSEPLRTIDTDLTLEHLIGRLSKLCTSTSFSRLRITYSYLREKERTEEPCDRATVQP